MFDTLKRITELRTARGWSVYHLAKLTDIPQSTISTWYRRGLCPPIDKIERLCEAFGISLSQFFYLEDTDNNPDLLFLHDWTLLSSEQQKIIKELIQIFIKQGGQNYAI